MKTYKWIFGILAILMLNACSTNSAPTDNPFRIQGEIANAADIEKVLLYEGETLVDSAVLDAESKFNFERTVEEPTLFTLLVGFRPYTLVLQNGDDLTFKTDLKQGDDYQVTGSALNEKMRELSNLRVKLQKDQNAIQDEYEKRIEEGEEQSLIQADLMEKSQLSMAASAQEIYDFAFANRKNLAGLYGMLFLYSVDPTGYETELIQYTEEATDEFPENSTLQYFANHMKELKGLSIGQPAPDFTSTTPEGETVKLSDLRGKYVLLDFWAAWCGPCRQENPNIVEQYHTFKDKGFTVLGVSLDRTKEAWVKAIYQDKLDWTQVSDLKEWNSEAGQLYNITAIPASFMIGPDGKLVAKNLRGAALKRFLEETLK